MPKKPLMLLHGFTGSRHSWDELRPELESRYEIITPDIIGHGEAPIPDEIAPYHIEAEAARIAAMITEPVHLYGYSMGGRLALTLAIHHPDKVQILFLESATAGLKTEEERQARIVSDNSLADKIEENGMDWFADYWGKLSLWDNQSPEQKARLHQARLKNSSKGLANSLRGMGTGQMPPLWEALPSLKMPVKLIVGGLDSKFLSINQEMVALIPNAKLIIVPKASHAVHIENTSQIIDIMLQYSQL